MLEASHILSTVIPCDSEGKANIFGGDTINHCDKKVHINVCLIVNGYRDTAVRIYKSKSI
jgi:hypothetical protein